MTTDGSAPTWRRGIYGHNVVSNFPYICTRHAWQGLKPCESIQDTHSVTVTYSSLKGIVKSSILLYMIKKQKIQLRLFSDSFNCHWKQSIDIGDEVAGIFFKSTALAGAILPVLPVWGPDGRDVATRVAGAMLDFTYRNLVRLSAPQYKVGMWSRYGLISAISLH